MSTTVARCLPILLSIGLLLTDNTVAAETNAIQATPASLKLISAAELNTQLNPPLKTAKPPLVFDANTDGVRQTRGIVQGAALLSSYDSFDIGKELPRDKTRALVFYCYNEQCMASHIAAKRAQQAGYRNVAVMKSGIAGWADAGFPIRLLRKR